MGTTYITQLFVELQLMSEEEVAHFIVVRVAFLFKKILNNYIENIEGIRSSPVLIKRII